jgi:hypothetical protein
VNYGGTVVFISEDVHCGEQERDRRINLSNPQQLR